MKSLMFRILLVLSIFLSSSLLLAQATGTSRLVLDQAGPSLVDVNAYIYKYYPDSATVGITLTGVVCSGSSSPFVCVVNFPAFTPGSHTLTLSASNVAGEGPKSSSISFTFVVLPSAPINLRIQ